MEKFKNENIGINEVEAEELAGHIGEVVRLHGSIYKIRKMKSFSFVLLRTKRDVVQCVTSKDLEIPMEESCVILSAKVVEDNRSRVGYELQIETIEVLSSPQEIAPIVINQKIVDTSIENLLDFRPITLRNEKERAIFKLQEGICRAFREFLYRENFTEIHTPKIVQSGAEGGANIFKLDYFGQEAYLAQSPQFYKLMMAGVFERVFEIAPVFRAEKHDTSRHLNEYTSVDFEMGFISSFREIMEMETAMLQYTMKYLAENYEKELTLLNLTLPVIEKIPSVTFREAKVKVAEAYKRTVKDWEDFEPEEEKLLSALILQETGSEFVFVTHYPSEKRPFYAMENKDNPNETESFDLLFRGLEITTGGQRIHDYQEQVAKMQRKGMNVQLFESYLMMHKHGMPPHGGLGLGLERFTARLLGYENVRYTTLFPRDIKRLVP
ncbi:MAG: aspartate--tRNA(Asn) ligase [Lachnospiraceae bacterium]|nr:aspartate--tRNA(Asn) ligase [Lachnospiraceae bacterium]